MDRKVAIVGSFLPDEMGFHIKNNFEDMGWSVSSIQWPLFQQGGKIFRKVCDLTVDTPIYAELIKKSFHRYASGGLDLVISTHDFLTADLIRWLKVKYDCSIVIWMPDHIGNFGRAKFLHAGYDKVFLADKWLVTKLGDWFENVELLLEAFDPRYVHEQHTFCPEDNFRFSVSCVGNSHSFRVGVINAIEQVEPIVFGAPPPRWLRLNAVHANKPLFNAEKYEVFWSTKINLNTVHIADIGGFNARMFELLGSGGFSLHSSGLLVEDVFSEMDGLKLFDGRKELLKLIRYFSSSSTYLERKESALNLQALALGAHTYRHRIAEMLNLINMSS